MLVRTGTLRIPAPVAEFYAEHARLHDIDPEALIVEVLRRVAEQKRIPAPVPSVVEQDAPAGQTPPPAPVRPTASGKPRPATTYDDETIVRMLAEGARQSEIAKVLGRHQSFVLRRARALGVVS